MRSWSAPAWLSYIAAREPGGLEGTPFAILASRKALAFTILAALGETLADKTPIPPRRTHPVLLTWRATVGAFVGAAVFVREGRAALAGAVLGGMAGAASTFASYEARRRAVQKLGWPDPVVAVIEDGVVQGAGWAIARAQLREDRGDLQAYVNPLNIPLPPVL
jgi:uncharacterized membrane protein